MFRSMLLLCCLASAAHADTPTTYALVVGSNAAGPGQTALRYAEADATRVGSILGELGGVAPNNVDVLLQPTPATLRDHIAALEKKVAADVAAGKQARIFFYYSGHARASGLDLGSSSLPLAELRSRLFAVPATLTVVVLDACQSGAFSRVKGATPAADFSFNSRQQLDASGVAVLASSSGSELSQESESLKSSYFTHHLLVGMRGAGDANNDGTVSVDEAYRYAYHQTLLSTAMTAVGGQHVSLEVDLKGHGEVPLSFPRAATRAIVLPAAMEGQALVHDKRAKAVVAETHKAKGAAVRIAVAPGEYEVIVRQGESIHRCQPGPTGDIEMSRCTTEKAIAATRKGGGFERPYAFELFGTLGPERTDAYTDTLQAFGYSEAFLSPSRGLGLFGGRRVHEKLWVGAITSVVRGPRWTRENREIGEMPLRFDWNTYSALAVVRGVHHLTDTGLWSRFGLYAQLGAGLAVGHTRLLDQDDKSHTEWHVGPALQAGAGFHLGYPGYSSRIPSFLMSTSMTVGYDFVYAPAITNNLGETHASGGHRLTLGLGYSF